MLVSRGMEETVKPPPSLRGIILNRKRLVSDSVNNGVSISVKEYDESVDESKESVDESMKSCVNESMKSCVNKSMKRSIDESMKSCANKSMKKSIDESMKRSVDESTNPVNESMNSVKKLVTSFSISEPVHSSLDLSMASSCYQSTNHSFHQSVDQSPNQPIDHSLVSQPIIDQSTHQPIHQSTVNQSTHQPTINQPTNQFTTNLPINQPTIHPSTNQPTNQPTTNQLILPHSPLSLHGHDLFSAITTHSFCPSPILPLDLPLRAQRQLDCPSLNHLISRATSLSPHYFSHGDMKEGCFFLIDAASLRHWRKWLKDPAQTPRPLRFPSLCKHGGCAIPGFLRHFATGVTSVPCEVGERNECHAGNARKK